MPTETTEKKILLIEDDCDISDLITYYLGEYRFEVHAFSSAEGINQDELPDYEVILLDIMLPDSDGIALCAMFREQTDAPILFISAKDDSATIIRALNMGGDDYIVKPFDEAVLLARIDANLRRRNTTRERKAEEEESLRAGPFLLMAKEPAVLKDGKKIKLSPIEHQILALMLRNIGETLSMETIYRYIWGQPSLHDYRTITVHVSNLRKKLEDEPSNPRYIKTVWKIGYVFDV